MNWAQRHRSRGAPVLATRSSAEKLTTLEKAGYALGDTASNFYWKIFEAFLLFYYTDVFGLPAVQVGTMFFVTRVWDAFADPFMGIVADRTNTRYGKFRPYLLWFAVPMAATGVLTFTRPALEGVSLLAYAYVTYTAMMLAYTAVNIPYSALLGVITPNSRERASLSSFRFVGGFTGGLFVQLVTLQLVAKLGNGSAASGWQRTLILYGGIACIMFVVSFLSTRERIAPSPDQRADLRRDLRDLSANRPWWVLFALGIVVIITLWLRGGAAAYYFKYAAKREDLLGWFFATFTVAGIVGAAIAGPLARAAGKRNLYAIVMVVASMVTIAFYFVAPSDLGLLFGLNMALGLVLGPQAPVLWAMFADTADYSEWRTGRRSTGLVFAAGVFSMKVGGAVGGWLLAMLLDRFGYVPNVEQTQSSLRGIFLAMSIIPAGFGLVAAAVVSLYDLNEAKVATIERELGDRRASLDAVVAPLKSS